MRGRVITTLLVLLLTPSCDMPSESTASVPFPLLDPDDTSVQNGKIFKNPGGLASTWSTLGDLDLTNEFHSPQGSNGRSCGTCHRPDAGWSVNPEQIKKSFITTGGTDPIFNPLDANVPNAPVSTVQQRYVAYSQLLKGLFRRGSLPATGAREFDIIAATDPYGGGPSSGPRACDNPEDVALCATQTQRIQVFRRPLITANFHLAKNVGWDDANTRLGQTVPEGLFAQADNNISTAQAGPPPGSVDPAIVDAIVVYESALSFAQEIVPGVGHLTSDGARGGAEILSTQTLKNSRMSLFDTWIGISAPKKAQIARGQELFNNKMRPNGGGPCRGCHNDENNGSNVNGVTFDIGVSDEVWASIDNLPIYTVRNRQTLETIITTDIGKAGRSGKWSDMNRFKVPSLRGLAAHAPYFHNGLAKTLHEVVIFYEQALGFDYTPEEEQDLVAFMNAL